MIAALAANICIEIHFGEDGNPTHVELEECDDEDDLEDDESDEDFIPKES